MSYLSTWRARLSFAWIAVIILVGAVACALIPPLERGWPGAAATSLLFAIAATAALCSERGASHRVLSARIHVIDVPAHEVATADAPPHRPRTTPAGLVSAAG